MIIGEINSALTLLERLTQWYKKIINRAPELVSTRFVRLFECHGVHRNQIPRYIGCGLTLQAVQSDAALLAQLNEEALSKACNHFVIRRQWLDGVDIQIHPCHDFYKDPEAFSDFITELRQRNVDGEFGGVLLSPDRATRHGEAVIVLQESIGKIDDQTIYRYHICNGWAFSYWKARAYLTACIAIAWKQGIYIHGREAHPNVIRKICEGEELLGWKGGGIWELGTGRWYPEDMALQPDVFLEGVEAETNNFGLRSGLKLWLDLAKEGHMDTGLDKLAVPLFEKALESVIGE